MNTPKSHSFLRYLSLLVMTILLLCQIPPNPYWSLGYLLATVLLVYDVEVSFKLQSRRPPSSESPDADHETLDLD